MNQADIWLLRSTESAKARPVVIVTRDRAIPVLQTLVVAPITSTIRQIPTAIPLDRSHGISRESVATFDNLTVVPKSQLTRKIGDLGSMGGTMVCHALEALADC